MPRDVGNAAQYEGDEEVFMDGHPWATKAPDKQNQEEKNK